MPARGFQPALGPASSLTRSVTSTGSTVVLALAGDADVTTAAELRQTLNDLLGSSRAPVVVVDLSGVRVVDAAAVGVIVAAHAAAAAQGRQLYVDGLQALPARVFKILALEWLRLPAAGGGRGVAAAGGTAMTDADTSTGSPVAGEPIGDRITRADLWEAAADERERLADERERLADERDRLADERDALADRHERDVSAREHHRAGHPTDDSDDGLEQVHVEAVLYRAEARLRRAEAHLMRARAAVARLEARRAVTRAAHDRAAAADRARAAADDEDRSWLADRRDFIASERDRLADLRDRIADDRDTTAANREREADQRERDALHRERELTSGPGPATAEPRVEEPPRRDSGEDEPTDPRRIHEQARAVAAARRQAAARQRRDAVWGPTVYGPMLVASFGEFARDLFAVDDIGEALQRALKFAVDAVSGCEWASVTLYRNGRVDRTIASDPVAAELDACQLATALGPVVEALHSDYPVLVPRLGDSPRWPDLSAVATRLGAASALSHGLFLHQQAQWSVLGVLTFYGAAPDAFSVDDQEFMTIVSAYLSVAVGVSQRQDDVERREAALHRGLATRDVIGQAKGILMERQRLSAGDAFDQLRRASQRLNRKLVDVAEYLADTGELPT